MNRLQKTSVTQKQIAEELGVSRQLVSLVLNGTGRISEDNRRRVQEAAERLGYDAHSNPEARAMIARRYSKRATTGLLGCVHFSVARESEAGSAVPLPYEAHLLQGIRHEAHRNGRDVLLLHPNPSSGWERVDGLLVHGKIAPSLHDRLGVDIPIVSMMCEAPGFSSVVAADRDGARQATEHLLDMGHRRIAYLAYPEGTPSVQRRLLGYQEALRTRGVRPQKSWVGTLVNFGPMLTRGHHSMKLWLENGWSRLGCTALLVQNDRAAIGAMAALRESGIQVPRQLSVVGFDGTDEREIAEPALTSVQVPLEEIGAAATQMLLRRIGDAARGEYSKPEIRELPTMLQLRESTAPPAA